MNKLYSIWKKNDIHSLAKSDRDYLNIMIESIKEPIIEGVKMPGFPDRDMQYNLVGSSNEKALRAGFRFYKSIKKYCEQYKRPVSLNTKILDFGCGWGRITRFFFNDVRSKNVEGVDVNAELIMFCKSDMNYGKYSVINPLPPIDRPGNKFDLIFAHSVFSHLAEHVALAWIEEFARILRSGGLLIATTWGRNFLDRCKAMRDQDHKNGTRKNWANAFIPVKNAKEDYDRGLFLYEPGPREGGPLDKSYFGLALIPKQYVEREYTKYLNLLDYANEKVKDPQAVFVMQKE